MRVIVKNEALDRVTARLQHLNSGNTRQRLEACRIRRDWRLQ